MHRLYLVVGLILVAIVAVWLWYFPSASLNYKLSVDVDDNGVMRPPDA